MQSPKQYHHPVDSIKYTEHLVRKTIQKSPLRTPLGLNKATIAYDITKNFALFINKQTSRLRNKHGKKLDIEDLYLAEEPNEVPIYPRLPRSSKLSPTHKTTLSLEKDKVTLEYLHEMQYKTGTTFTSGALTSGISGQGAGGRYVAPKIPPTLEQKVIDRIESDDVDRAFKSFTTQMTYDKISEYRKRSDFRKMDLQTFFTAKHEKDVEETRKQISTTLFESPEETKNIIKTKILLNKIEATTDRAALDKVCRKFNLSTRRLLGLNEKFFDEANKAKEKEKQYGALDSVLVAQSEVENEYKKMKNFRKQNIKPSKISALTDEIKKIKIYDSMRENRLKMMTVKRPEDFQNRPKNDKILASKLDKERKNKLKIQLPGPIITEELDPNQEAEPDVLELAKAQIENNDQVNEETPFVDYDPVDAPSPFHRQLSALLSEELLSKFSQAIPEESTMLGSDPGPGIMTEPSMSPLLSFRSPRNATDTLRESRMRSEEDNSRYGSPVSMAELKESANFFYKGFDEIGEKEMEKISEQISKMEKRADIDFKRMEILETKGELHDEFIEYKKKKAFKIKLAKNIISKVQDKYAFMNVLEHVPKPDRKEFMREQTILLRKKTTNLKT